MDRYTTIKIRLDGCHYQPDGCDMAFVTGISWDNECQRPALQLTYINGEMDYIPLSSLGVSHILGSVTIIPSEERRKQWIEQK